MRRVTIKRRVATFVKGALAAIGLALGLLFFTPAGAAAQCINCSGSRAVAVVASIITSFTGSGTVGVLATSPTLVTPILGVATATSVAASGTVSAVGLLNTGGANTSGSTTANVTASNVVETAGVDTFNVVTAGTGAGSAGDVNWVLRDGSGTLMVSFSQPGTAEQDVTMSFGRTTVITTSSAGSLSVSPASGGNVVIGTTGTGSVATTTAASAAGVNGYTGSGANAAGEFGHTVGTTATTTNADGFVVANDIDGTPAPVFKVTGGGMLLAVPLTTTVGDDAGGTKPAITLTPRSTQERCACNDATGCTVTLGEGTPSGFAPIADGMWTTLTSTGTGNCELADTSGLTELSAGFVMGGSAAGYDSITLDYVVDRWVERGRSNN